MGVEMTRFCKAMLLAMACVLPPVAAMAQGTCPEGRTASGQCVNAGLADSMRLGAVIYSQPKISYSQYPILPSQDWNSRYPNQLNPDPLKPSPTGTPAPIVVIP